MAAMHAIAIPIFLNGNVRYYLCDHRSIPGVTPMLVFVPPQNSIVLINADKMAVPITNELFMEEIRKYPVIYDRYIKAFKDQNKKRNAWENVSKATGLSVAECQKRYKNIHRIYIGKLNETYL